MGPLIDEHPLVTSNDICPGCHQMFEGGQFVTLIPIGPGANAEARKKAREGSAYNAVAIAAHWACVTGEE
jgi:hypothetical protein